MSVLANLRHDVADMPASQQPNWPDSAHVDSVVQELEGRKPLVSQEECARLTERLGEVASGNAFLLHAGDCAETLEYDPDTVEHTTRVILSMTASLLNSGMKVVKVGRIAGQTAKPRSSDTEEQDGIALPSYRGDMVNGLSFTKEARQPDPDRLLQTYDMAEHKIAQQKRLTNSDFANLEHANKWNIEFADSTQSARYMAMTKQIERSIAFMIATGADLDDVRHTEVFTSHEGLILPYELGLTRLDQDGKPYDSSSHMIWIGKRTLQLDGAHVAYCSEISNSVGAKIGPEMTPEEIIALCDKLDSHRIPGRLNLIARMGVDAVAESLPPLLRAVKSSGHPVIWSSDPMHGNTYAEVDRKTRHFDTIYSEFDQFIGICEAEDVWPGGVHLELTGENVTECLGGIEPSGIKDLEANYNTACDPRLNGEQGMELAFLISSRLAKL